MIKSFWFWSGVTIGWKCRGIISWSFIPNLNTYNLSLILSCISIVFLPEKHVRLSVLFSMNSKNGVVKENVLRRKKVYFLQVLWPKIGWRLNNRTGIMQHQAEKWDWQDHQISLTLKFVIQKRVIICLCTFLLLLILACFCIWLNREKLLSDWRAIPVPPSQCLVCGSAQGVKRIFILVHLWYKNNLIRMCAWSTFLFLLCFSFEFWIPSRSLILPFYD